MYLICQFDNMIYLNEIFLRAYIPRYEKYENINRFLFDGRVFSQFAFSITFLCFEINNLLLLLFFF